MEKALKIAVAGAGFSGSLVALHILRSNPSATVILIERAAEFGRGLAYGTCDPKHLLNVRASNMSAFPEDPDHFIKWLALHMPPHSRPQSFVPRHIFGTYLQSLLRATLATDDGAERLIILPDEVTALLDRPDGIGLRLAMGREIDVDHVVLATGHLPSHDLPGFEQDLLDSSVYIRDPWAPHALAQVQPGENVLLIGAGLTAVDVLLGLDRAGHNGNIVAISRRGLKPRPHADVGPAPLALDVPERLPLSGLVRLVRKAAILSGDWRAAADGLRPHSQRLWQEASGTERSRFLRHLRPWWEVHRHRMAPPVATAIASLERFGRLSIRAGKITNAKLDNQEALVSWRPRGQPHEQQIRFSRIINCTGPAGNVQKAASPLLADLISRGCARPDAQGLGIEVDAQCRLVGADGTPNPRITAIGPISRGAFWEITAVPDIRVQASMVAERLV